MENRAEAPRTWQTISSLADSVQMGRPRARLALWLRHYWRLWAAALLIAVALLLGNCASPAPQTLAFGAAVWQDGEQAVYTISTANESFAGTATFDVLRGTQSGEEGWTFRRDLSALGDQEIVVAEMSEAGYRPISSTLVRISREGSEQITARYEGSQVNMNLVTRQNVATSQTDSIPSDAREQRTLPLIVRTLPLADGYATQLNTYLPVTGRLDRVSVSVRERVDLTVAAGTFDAWEVRLRTEDSTSTLWIGVQPPHPLLKFEDARANATYELQTFRPAAP